MCMWVWPAEFEADSLCKPSSRCKTSSHTVCPRQHELLSKANVIDILQAELHCTLLVAFGEPALSIAPDTHFVLQHMCTHQPSHSIRHYIATRRNHCRAVSLLKHRLLCTVLALWHAANNIFIRGSYIAPFGSHGSRACPSTGYSAPC